MDELGADGPPTFESVCDLLQCGHRAKASHTPEQTLNRLFCKHLNGHKPQIAKNPPWLSNSNTDTVMEMWAKPDLQKLAPRTDSRKPRFSHYPVVIIRYRGFDCLIDGGSRIHAWFQAGEMDEHAAWVLIVSHEPHE